MFQQTPCALCGLLNYGDRGLCGHHDYTVGTSWSDENRIWCGYFHRGEEILRQPDAIDPPLITFWNGQTWNEVPF